MKRTKPEPDSCPCGSGLAYAACCGPLHTGDPAATAEALMRSRYSAYVRMNETYLLATWHPSTRPSRLDQNPLQWIGLTVQHHEQHGDQASVAFVARYKLGGRAHKMAETSRFVREDGRWFYITGEVSER